ncbi:hypothetical protein K438DRAFT_1861269 [Mycena galopus ATCC 62051]|nr:hypothetical protein K438DRAFT_1861269 [Mycena galopus ATCC 62051]
MSSLFLGFALHEFTAATIPEGLVCPASTSSSSTALSSGGAPKISSSQCGQKVSGEISGSKRVWQEKHVGCTTKLSLMSSFEKTDFSVIGILTAPMRSPARTENMNARQTRMRPAAAKVTRCFVCR